MKWKSLTILPFLGLLSFGDISVKAADEAAEEADIKEKIKNAKETHDAYTAALNELKANKNIQSVGSAAQAYLKAREQGKDPTLTGIALQTVCKQHNLCDNLINGKPGTPEEWDVTAKEILSKKENLTTDQINETETKAKEAETTYKEAKQTAIETAEAFLTRDRDYQKTLEEPLKNAQTANEDARKAAGDAGIAARDAEVNASCPWCDEP